MKQKILELDGSKYVLNNRGLSKISWFIRECHAKRKEILDATKDTADDTILPTFDDIVSDIEEFWGEDGLEEYCNCWGITDNYRAIRRSNADSGNLQPAPEGKQSLEGKTSGARKTFCQILQDASHPCHKETVARFSQ